MRPIEENLLRKYELVTTACDQHRIYHLNTVEDLDLDVSAAATSDSSGDPAESAHAESA